MCSLTREQQDMDSCIVSVNVKFVSCFLFQIWQAALSALNPNPTDSCPLYLNHATVAALPSRVSRHNSPASAHFLSRLVRSCLPGGNNRCIIVSILCRHICFYLLLTLFFLPPSGWSEIRFSYTADLLIQLVRM